MRAYLTRLDPSGGLNDLADALDRQFYGGAGGGPDARTGNGNGDGSHYTASGTPSVSRCRRLRRYIRRTIKRRPAAGKEGGV